MSHSSTQNTTKMGNSAKFPVGTNQYPCACGTNLVCDCASETVNQEGQKCQCFSCNCHHIQVVQNKGFLVKTLEILFPKMEGSQHNVTNCHAQDSRKSCQKLRSKFITSVVAMLKNISFRSVSLSSLDTGHRNPVVIDFVLDRNWSESEFIAVSDTLKRNGCLGVREVDLVHAIHESELNLILSGLTCQSCIKKIYSALNDLKGVLQAKVTLTSAIIKYDELMVSPGKMMGEIRNLGYGCSKQPPIDESGQSTIGDSDTVLLLQKSDTLIPIDRSDMVKSTFSIGGMTCTSCVHSIENALKRIPGVNESNTIVSLLPPRAIVIHNASIVTGETLSESIEEMGFDSILMKTAPLEGKVQLEKIHEVKINVGGITCSSCTNAIKKHLETHSGIVDAEVNLSTSIADVKYLCGMVGPRDIVTMIEDIGYEAKIKLDTDDPEFDTKEERSFRNEALIALLFALPTFIIAMVFMMIFPFSGINLWFMEDLIPGLKRVDLILFCLATPVQLGLGFRFYKGAWKSFRYLRSANMDTLIALGTSCAYFYSIYAVVSNIWDQKSARPQFFETSVFLIFFVLAGKYLEVVAKGKTTSAIKALQKLTPDKVSLVEINPRTLEVLSESSTDLSLVQIGDVVKVRPGERIPCDGMVLGGDSYVDESMLTGESNPVHKIGESLVIGGTVNRTGILIVKILKTGKDTTLARIIQLVEDAQSHKAPIQDYADRISAVFVPSVLFIAAMTFSCWYLGLQYGIIPISLLSAGYTILSFALEHAVAVLVIACPCALGLATPTAVMVGSGVAANLGILIKGGGATLESVSKLGIIAFDKTGTLTVLQFN